MHIIRIILILAMFVLRTILIILGWILVPLAAKLEAYYSDWDEGKEKKGEDPIVYHFNWKLMWLWDNWEDGIANTTYEKADNMFEQIVYWSANRNPVNNLRRVKGLSLKIDPKNVKWTGGPHKLPQSYDLKPPSKEWYFAWHGIYSCIWIQRTFLPNWVPLIGGFRRFWLGWKIYPNDIHGVNGHRKDLAGFATQFKRLKK